jgi:hypothetical protein
VLRPFAAVFTELLDGLFTELFDAVLTELLTELLDGLFTELFVDDLAATALPRDPPLLTCFDLEEAFAAATFGLLGLGDLAVLGLAGIRGAATLAGLTRTFGGFSAGNRFRLNSAVEVDAVQTSALSFQSMPALPQSALVSGWLERGSPDALMNNARRSGPALPSLGE